jgi:hypothetical protein
MAFLRKAAWPLFRFICIYSVGHGILLWLATKGLHPDQWVARVIGYAGNVQVAEYAWFIIIGIFGLIGTIAWELLAPIFKRTASSAISAAATQVHVAGTEAGFDSALIGSPLKIEFGNGEKYERIDHHNETGIFRRTIYISVFNESMDDISDCNIKLIAATPRPKTGASATNFPVGFRENFDLRGKQRKFIQIVRFAENPGNGSALERDNIIILAASGGFFPGWTTIPILSADNPAILTLEAFAPSIESRMAHLHIYVTERRIHAKII